MRACYRTASTDTIDMGLASSLELVGGLSLDRPGSSGATSAHPDARSIERRYRGARVKYVPLIWAGFWRKPARAVLTMLCIMMAFVLYGTLHGVTTGLDEVIGKLSATRLRVMNRVNSIDSLPMAYKSQIEALPNVSKVAYYQTMVGYYQEPKNGIGVGAIGLDEFLDSYPEVVLPAEQREAMRANRTGAIVGRKLAEQYGWKLGDRVPIKSRVFAKSDGSYDWAFDIVGIYDYADGFDTFAADEMWINFAYFDAERITRKKNYVLLYFVTVDDPDVAAAVSERIDAMFANSASPTQTMNERDSMRAGLKRLGNINFLVRSIIAAVFFTLLFVTGNTMMQSVRERIPEFAVLKTYGFRDGVIMALVLAESLMLCVCSAALGIGIAATFFPLVLRNVGLGTLLLPISVLAIGLGFAALLAVISALPPALRARRLKVVDALVAR
jgi:putative ABC transport system permease protein